MPALVQAAELYSDLLSQGKRPQEALAHARLQYGVNAGDILMIVRLQHSLSLADA